MLDLADEGIAAPELDLGDGAVAVGGIGLERDVGPFEEDATVGRAGHRHDRLGIDDHRDRGGGGAEAVVVRRLARDGVGARGHARPGVLPRAGRVRAQERRPIKELHLRDTAIRVGSAGLDGEGGRVRVDGAIVRRSQRSRWGERDGDGDGVAGRGEAALVVVGLGEDVVGALEDVLPGEGPFAVGSERTIADLDADIIEFDLGDGAVEVGGGGLEGDAGRFGVFRAVGRAGHGRHRCEVARVVEHVRRDGERPEVEALHGFEAVDLEDGRVLLAGDEVDVPVCRLVERRPECFQVAAHPLDERSALNHPRLIPPQRVGAVVFEELGHEIPVRRQQVGLAVVRVDTKDGTGIPGHGGDQVTERVHRLDDLAGVFLRRAVDVGGGEVAVGALGVVRGDLRPVLVERERAEEADEVAPVGKMVAVQVFAGVVGGHHHPVVDVAREVVHRHAVGADGRGRHLEAEDAGEGQVFLDEGGAHEVFFGSNLLLAVLHLGSFYQAIAVVIRPDVEDFAGIGVVGGVCPQRLDIVPLGNDSPYGNRIEPIILEQPDGVDGPPGPPFVVVADQVLAPSHVTGPFGCPFMHDGAGGEVLHVYEDALHLAGARRPVQLELDGAHGLVLAALGIVEAGLVGGVEHPAAAVLGRAVPGLVEGPGQGIPAGDTLGRIMLFGDPQHAVVIDGNTARVGHPCLVVEADLGAAGRADGTLEHPGVDVEDFHLVARPPVADVDFRLFLVDEDALWVLQAGRDNEGARAQGASGEVGAVAFHLLALKQVYLLVVRHGHTARVGLGDLAQDGLGREVYEDHLVKGADREEGHLVVDRQAFQVVVVVAGDGIGEGVVVGVEALVELVDAQVEAVQQGDVGGEARVAVRPHVAGHLVASLEAARHTLFAVYLGRVLLQQHHPVPSLACGGDKEQRSLIGVVDIAGGQERHVPRGLVVREPSSTLPQGVPGGGAGALHALFVGQIDALMEEGTGAVGARRDERALDVVGAFGNRAVDRHPLVVPVPVDRVGARREVRFLNQVADALAGKVFNDHRHVTALRNIDCDRNRLCLCRNNTEDSKNAQGQKTAYRSTHGWVELVPGRTKLFTPVHQGGLNTTGRGCNDTPLRVTKPPSTQGPNNGRGTALRSQWVGRGLTTTCGQSVTGGGGRRGSPTLYRLRWNQS